MRQLTERQLRSLDSRSHSSGLFLEFEFPPVTDSDPAIESDGGERIEIPSRRVIDPNLPNQVIRVWSHMSVIQDSAGNSWIGVGHTASWSGISASNNTRTNRVSFILSNVPRDKAVIEADIDVKGLPGTLYYGIIDANSRIIDDLIPILKFKLDNTRLDNDGQTSAITLNTNSGLVDLLTPTAISWSAEAQKMYLDELVSLGLIPQGTTDSGFDDMADIGNKQVLWRTGKYRSPSQVRVTHLTSISGTRQSGISDRQRDHYEPN